MRISPLWWPVLGLASPILAPALLLKNRRFREDIIEVRELNSRRFKNAHPLDLPELDFLKLRVLLEEKTEPGFLGAPGVSYHIKTDRGALLFDLGYGSEEPALAHNACKLNFQLDQVAAVVISHLHPDHMGGFKAVRNNEVLLPDGIGAPDNALCFLPAYAKAEGFNSKVVTGPQMVAAGLATTGPLARSLFLMGRTDEQTLVGRLKDRGIVIITGCGHPTIKKILEFVRVLTSEPIHAVCGGFHLPISDSPLRKPGLKVQMIWGTGKPPWKRITDRDLDETIKELRRSGAKRILLSHHDCCDRTVDRMTQELPAEVTLLKAGGTYVL